MTGNNFIVIKRAIKTVVFQIKKKKNTKIPLGCKLELFHKNNDMYVMHVSYQQHFKTIFCRLHK